MNNLENIINIYDDWSADGSVNNMTIRDLIINSRTRTQYQKYSIPKLLMLNQMKERLTSCNCTRRYEWTRFFFIFFSKWTSKSTCKNKRSLTVIWVDFSFRIEKVSNYIDWNWINSNELEQMEEKKHRNNFWVGCLNEMRFFFFSWRLLFFILLNVSRWIQKLIHILTCSA